MYSSTIKPKVDKMFDDLRAKASKIISETNSANDAIRSITRRVASDTASRSKSILSDMLFDLSDTLLKTPFFDDVLRQNKFTEINLRQEILSKYQFTASSTVDYEETSRIIRGLKYGGGIIVVGGIAEIGVVLLKGLSMSSLVPIPISVLVAAALGIALVDCLAIEPKLSKKRFTEAVDKYLVDAQQQFQDWFDEIERYFNMRVEEIKKTI